MSGWVRRLTSAVGRVPRALRRNVVYRVTALALALALALVGAVLWQYRANIGKDAQARTATLAYLLAEQTTRTFQAVDLTLAGLEPVFDAAPLPDHAPGFEKLLAQRVEELDFIHALYVVDAAGAVTQSAGAADQMLTGSAIKPYLETFAREPRQRLLIGRPLFGRLGQLSAIPVMRLLATPAAHPAMLVASVEPRFFSDFYRNLDLGRRGSVDLYQDNGSILLASTTSLEGVDVALAPPVPPRFDLASTLGSFKSDAGESRPRLVAFHRATGYPLVVAVGYDLAELWLRWWRVAAPTAVAAGVVVVLAVALAVMVSRRLEERQQARRRAVTLQKLEALGQMTASVAHDFRNLLAVVSAALRMIRKRGPDETVLQAADAAVERGASLVTQLLAFSRRDEIEVQAADLNLLLDGLEQVLRYAAGPGVTLVLDKGVGLPPCRVDRTQFDAALMNLVVNARQAMPDGGTVTISTRNSTGTAGFVALQVADTGMGIPPAHARRVFEPFYTTKADGGTGLGLAQVHGFMRRIGGDVSVASEVGIGTVFTLVFPAVMGEASADPLDLARPAA